MAKRDGMATFEDLMRAMAYANEVLGHQRVERALAGARDFADIPAPHMTQLGPDIGIRAATYRPANPLGQFFKPKVNTHRQYICGQSVGEVSPDGKLRYKRMILPVGHGLNYMVLSDRYDGMAKVFFDDDIAIPTLDYATDDGWDVWMSITPAEVWSMASGVEAATGRVIIGGLGMGYLLSQVAAKPDVASIVVVEENKALLDWYGDKLCMSIPKVEAVICGDVWEVASSFDIKRDVFLIDIWPEYFDALDDVHVKQLRGRGATVWAWGEVVPEERGI